MTISSEQRVRQHRRQHCRRRTQLFNNIGGALKQLSLYTTSTVLYGEDYLRPLNYLQIKFREAQRAGKGFDSFGEWMDNFIASWTSPDSYGVAKGGGDYLIDCHRTYLECVQDLRYYYINLFQYHLERDPIKRGQNQMQLETIMGRVLSGHQAAPEEAPKLKFLVPEYVADLRSRIEEKLQKDLSAQLNLSAAKVDWHTDNVAEDQIRVWKAQLQQLSQSFYASRPSRGDAKEALVFYYQEAEELMTTQLLDSIQDQELLVFCQRAVQSAQVRGDSGIEALFEVISVEHRRFRDQAQKV